MTDTPAAPETTVLDENTTVTNADLVSGAPIGEPIDENTAVSFADEPTPVVEPVADADPNDANTTIVDEATTVKSEDPAAVPPVATAESDASSLDGAATGGEPASADDFFERFVAVVHRVAAHFNIPGDLAAEIESLLRAPGQ